MSRMLSWVVLLIALFGSPAHASDASPDVDQFAPAEDDEWRENPDGWKKEGPSFLPGIDAKEFRRTRTPYWIGLGGWLGGTAAGVAFITLSAFSCMEGCSSLPPLPIILISTSIATALAGQGAMVFSGLWGREFLRGHGLHVRNEFAIAAAVVPLAAVATGVTLGLLAGKDENHKPQMVIVGLMVGTAGWLVAPALAGTQVRQDRRVALGKVRYQASVAPMILRGGAGVQVTARW